MNRFCGSSMYAIHVAAGQIAMGAGDAFIAGGVESMTMVPQGGFNFSPNPRFAFDGQPGTDQFYDAYISMGQTAENVAARHGIAREDQERLAVDSHAKAARAQADGLLAGEIVPVVLADGSRGGEDGRLRAGHSVAVSARPKPEVGSGSGREKG